MTKEPPHLAQSKPAPGTITRVNDCWNTIGIEGDRSCPQLAELVRCRNCAIFTEAAIQILEMQPLAYDTSAHVLAPEARPAGSVAIVTFRLGSEYLALPAAAIEEIGYESAIHTLPHRRSKLPIGLANVRGELLLFVDLAAMLGTEPSGAAGEQKSTGGRHIVFGDAGSRFVFRADEVCDVIFHRPEELDPVPTTLSSASFTTGLLKRGSRTIACLALEHVVQALNREVA